MIETSPTLLAKVKDMKDGVAWLRFDGLYRPLLCRWVRASGAPASAVDDIVQDVLIAVQRALSHDFAYDPAKGGFRKYLGQVVRSKVIDHFRQRKRRPPHVALLADEGPGYDPNEKLWEQQYREHVVRRCMEQVRSEVDEENWKIFLAYRVEKETAKNLAARLGISEQAVASRAFRIVERLRDLARSIDPDLWPQE
jgi:RNA polymerase sigma-70 factor (ECF subfamily)